MVKSSSNLAFYARIFVRCTLLIAVPCFVLLGYNYLNTLSERGYAARICIDAQNLASQQQANLQTMNALLTASQAQLMNALSSSVNGIVQDSSLIAWASLTTNEILTRQASFDQALPLYQQNYELATSSNMAGIRTILLNDNPNAAIISNQQSELNSVSANQWPTYKQLQAQELNQLKALQQELQSGHQFTPSEISQAYADTYLTLWNANQQFTGLKNSWQQVVNAAVSSGKTVSSVGPSQSLPVYISIVFTCTILLLFAIVWGFTSFQQKRSFSLFSDGKNSGNTPVPPSGSIPPVPQLP